MKAFSPAGMAVKGFFGYGSKTFGNPTGATSGNGGTNPPITPTVVALTNWNAGWTLNSAAGNHDPTAFGAQGLPHSFLVVVAEQQAGVLDTGSVTFGGQANAGGVNSPTGGYGMMIFDLHNFPPANDVLDFAQPAGTINFNSFVAYAAPNQTVSGILNNIPGPFDWVEGGSINNLFVVLSQADNPNSISTTSNDPAQLNQTVSTNPFGNGQMIAVWQIPLTTDPVDFTVSTGGINIQNTAIVQLSPT